MKKRQIIGFSPRYIVQKMLSSNGYLAFDMIMAFNAVAKLP